MTQGKGLIFVALAVFAFGCAPAKPAVRKTLPVGPWTLPRATPTEFPDDPAALANGYVGVRVDPLGSPAKDFPLFFADAYQKSGEEKIIPYRIVGPEIGFSVEGKPVDASATDPARIDLRTDSFQNELPSGFRVVSHLVPGQPILVQRVFGEQLTVSADGKPVTGWNAALQLSPTIPGEPERTGAVLVTRTPEGVVVTWDFRMDRARPVVFSEPTDSAWSTDIQIEGPVEDQRAVRGLIRSLRNGVSASSGQPVSPFGLNSAQYNGHVFWDADIWVFPALALLDPARAKSIADYRLRLFPAARRNFAEWAAAGRPTGHKPMGPYSGTGGAKYPWESSVTGRETVPGESKFQDHITFDVAFMLQQASALGLVSDASADAVLRAAGKFAEARSVAGPRGREIKGTMSPDEFHTGDNDLYTNVLASWAMNGGKHGPDRFALPADKETLLTYDNDGLRKYKQAAAVLSVYPLQHPGAEKQAAALLARFGPKVTANGPSMSDSIHALIGARVGEVEPAYALWRKDLAEFTAFPYLQFSEKRRRAATVFTTGAGGSLQTVLFGFCGLRIDRRPAPGSVWQTPLRNGYVLSCRPNLPAAWKSVRLEGLTVLGKKVSLEIRPGSVRAR